MQYKNFFIVPNRIFELELKPRDFTVYCCLLRHSDSKDGSCFPSRRVIAKECGTSPDGNDPTNRARWTSMQDSSSAVNAASGYISNEGKPSNRKTMPFNARFPKPNHRMHRPLYSRKCPRYHRAAQSQNRNRLCKREPR